MQIQCRRTRHFSRLGMHVLCMGVSRPWWRKPLAHLLRVRPRPRHLKGSIVHRLMGPRLFEPALWSLSREAVAKGVAIGAFLGFSPLIGLHLPLSILLCCLIRANVMVAILATFVSNPFTLAALTWLQLKTGRWILPSLSVHALHSVGVARYFALYGQPWLVGSFVFSVVGGLAAYFLASWMFLDKGTRRRRELTPP